MTTVEHKGVQLVGKVVKRKSSGGKGPSPEEIEERVVKLAKLPFREVDAELGVSESNGIVPDSGYLSPRYYPRQPLETDEQKEKRRCRVDRMLRKK